MIIDGWRNIIDVWRPEIVIPEKLLTRVAELNPLGGRKLRDDGGVDLCSIFGVDGLIADGICDWHDDQFISHQYTLILVIRNDHGSYVQCDSINVIKDQPPGTMIFLDIYKQHRLWNDQGNDTPIGVWYGVNIDLSKPPHDRKACEELMRKRLEKVGNG